MIKKKSWYVRGVVPAIHIKAEKIMNKKQTQVGGLGGTLELLQVDPEELRRYLSQTLGASATIYIHTGSAKAGSKETWDVMVQGEFCAEVKQVLVSKYGVNPKLITTENKIPSKKKKKAN